MERKEKRGHVRQLYGHITFYNALDLAIHRPLMTLNWQYIMLNPANLHLNSFINNFKNVHTVERDLYICYLYMHPLTSAVPYCAIRGHIL